MTRRSSTPLRPTRRRRRGSPIQRAAGGQMFTTLGFSFFRLIALDEPGEPTYAVLRLSETRRMAAFA
jgi:hypothetical protein